ncbi:MAG: TetR/AcrR family transcriptional regulator [Verrucomicrobiales bacterium]
MCATSQRSSSPHRGAANTRARLIDAARVEFSEKGIECATTRSIAERAQCNEVTLFRHFESKQKLLAAVVRDTSEEFRALCESPLEMSGDLRGDLERYALVYNKSLEGCEGMMRALIGEGRRRPLLTKELIGDVLAPFHQSIADYLEKEAKAGTVRNDVEAMPFAEIFTSTLMGGLLLRTSGLSMLDRDAWIRETVELLARGVEVCAPR